MKVLSWKPNPLPQRNNSTKPAFKYYPGYNWCLNHSERYSTQLNNDSTITTMDVGLYPKHLTWAKSASLGGQKRLTWWAKRLTWWAKRLTWWAKRLTWWAKMEELRNLPKEGKNLPSKLHNFWTIDFGEILTSFDRTNEGSRLWIRVFFTRFKNFFWDLVLVRDRWGAKTGWMMLGPGPKLFSSPFFCSLDSDAGCILRDVLCN